MNENLDPTDSGFNTEELEMLAQEIDQKFRN